MNDSFTVALGGVIVVATLFLGVIIGYSRVQSSCEKLGSFFIENKVYECKVK